MKTPSTQPKPLFRRETPSLEEIVNGPVPMDGGPGEAGYAWPSWREALADAQGGIDAAHERRKRVFQAAYDAGLTLAQIAEVVGLSAAGVHKIIGRQRGASLDDPAFGKAAPS